MIGAKWAFGLGAALIAGFALVIAFTTRDAAQRATLETVTEPRAVGDERFFPATEPIDVGKPLVTVNGRQLRAVENEFMEHRASRMEKTSEDDSGSFFIYKSLDEPPEFLFLKASPDKYVKARSE